MEQARKKVIALGFFDGVHLGHQALLRRTVERAAERGFIPAVFTFDRSPKEFVTGVPVPLLTMADARKEAIQSLFPIQEVITAAFDEKMMTMPWVDFVLELTQKYQAGWLVAGHDFRFGYKNSGTPALLSRKAAALGMGCDIIPAVTIDGVTVSSTYIRTLLMQGAVEEVTRFLGRAFSLSGPVRHGKGIGSSRLGTPTVNLVPPAGQLVPAFGVYAARVTAGGRSYAAVTNVGVRPTVDENGGITVESHLLDQSVQLYGKGCRVEFLRRLRPEKKFESIDALREQIIQDAGSARAYFAGNGNSPPSA